MRRLALALAALCLFPATGQAQRFEDLVPVVLPLAGGELLGMTQVQKGITTSVKITAAQLATQISRLQVPIPTADLLGGANNNFTSVAVGTGLLLAGGTLSAPVATSGAFGIVKPDNTTVTISGGVLSAAPGCGNGLSLGTVLFANGANTCTGDAARLFWNTTTDTAAGHILFVTGGNLFGHVVNIAADQAAGGGWNPALSTLFLGANNSDPTAPYGLVGTWGPLAAPLRTSINPDGGTVAIGAGSSTLGLADPVALLINNHSADAWTTAFGSALAFRGGVWNKNTHDGDGTATELRLWSGATERARISAALAGTSMVPNRFTAAGITDNTILSCNGTNSAIQTNGSGDVVCGSIGGGGGGGTLAGNNVWTGSNTFAAVIGAVSTQSGTTYTLAAADCGTEIRFSNAGAIAVTVPNSLPAGCNVAMMQAAAGQITVSAGAGATLLANPHAFTKSFGQNAIVGVSVDTNAGGSSATFTFVGDGA